MMIDGTSKMSNEIDSIQTLTQLESFVHKTLCAKENLLTDQFHTRSAVLNRGKRPCGMQFTLMGPRSVRLGAVWASDQNMLYFYDARGQRYDKVRLKNRIFVEQEANAA